MKRLIIATMQNWLGFNLYTSGHVQSLKMMVAKKEDVESVLHDAEVSDWIIGLLLN